MNSFTLVGNIGMEPETKHFESGMVVCKFSVADNQKKKDAPPIWWSVEVWGKSAEFVQNYCSKGTKVAVSGYIKQDQWTNKDGEVIKKLVVNASNVEKLSKDTDKAPVEETKAVESDAEDDYENIPF